MPMVAVPVWKKIPFFRLLVSLVTGISLQWYLQISFYVWAIILGVSFLVFLFFSRLSSFSRMRLAAINGFFIIILFISIGALLAFKADIRNRKQWFGHSYTNQFLLVTLNENLIEKTKSFKANASISYLVTDSVVRPVAGNIILYFSKDAVPADMGYGSVLLLRRSLQPIRNTGNPGAFDYRRYCLFQGITHQAYLRKTDFNVLNEKQQSHFTLFINDIRQWVLSVLRTYIPGNKEKGLAEALLIGYKDDLDKTLVQSYTNTGVVHIIAISGLHLGFIYWLLQWLLKPLQYNRRFRLLHAVLIILGLWLFSVLAGAQPSILRSAVMFTCIVIGNSIGKSGSVYNSLAASAFLLLCYNPYWLWDVGFQLSYTAVLSIVIFMKPVYNQLYFKNKLLDYCWKLNAVTIAAQILTVPVSVYHFHQFPNYFLLTNFLAVPLSGLILGGEIILCAISFLPVIAAFVGKILSGMIWCMNTWIERIEALPYSMQDGLQISFIQMLVLFVVIFYLSYWLLEKQNRSLIAGLLALLVFAIVHSVSVIQARQQQKIIVYNVPGKSAIDIINGNNYTYIGDSTLIKDDFLRNFHLKPSRILHHIPVQPSDVRQNIQRIAVAGKQIIRMDTVAGFKNIVAGKEKVDVLILSGNPRIYVSGLAALLDIRHIVIDGTVPAWKSSYWKKDCDSLHIPCHDVSEKGAFVMNLR